MNIWDKRINLKNTVPEGKKENKGTTGRRKDIMDKLEKYISTNRDELDMYSPDQEIWENIQASLKVRSGYRRKIMSMAAAILILLGSSLGLLWYRANNAAYSAPPELLESELFYSKRVESLLNEARPYLTSMPDLGNELAEEMNNLDSIYLELKKDLKDNVSNEDVVEALIVNYRVRIRILEEMLTILKEEKENNDKNNKHEI